MNLIKLKFYVFLTNWVNIIGVFVISYLSILILGYKEIGFPFILISALISIFLYGMIFWIGFIITIFILDFIFFNQNTKYLFEKLFTEWLIIGSPFVYWIFKYEQFFFIVLIIAFGVTQYIRKNKILKILENNNFEINHSLPIT
jgi:hypothetical protein